MFEANYKQDEVFVVRSPRIWQEQHASDHVVNVVRCDQELYN